MHKVHIPGFLRPQSWLAAATAALMLAACGGGGGEAEGTSAAISAATEKATAYEAGPITGFGSIIVNGVRYDDSIAAVSDDDGVSRSRSELKLGMMVEVDGSSVDRAQAKGRALAIRYGSGITGPVEAVDATAGTLTVLGQQVRTTSTTVLGDGLSAGLSALTAGASVVEVHGLWDAATLSYTATRVEIKTSATLYRLRGTVSGLDTTAKTFTINGATINYATATVPSAVALADGQSVRVYLQTSQVNGQWVATTVRNAGAKLEDRSSGHIHGSVTAFTSSTAFSVNGVPVDASAASFPDGNTGVVLGARVEVEGSLVNGVLVATKVELDDRRSGEDRHKFELHGSITSIDTAAKTFVLRGVTVSYASGVTYERGTEAGLVVGAKLEVKGTPGADRTTLTASRIKFED